MLVKTAQSLIKSARSEEDLRIGFERKLIPLLEGIGVPIHSQYEKSILFGKGRSDAIHGQVIIEYEAPGSFVSNPKVEHAKDQLINYIIGEAKGLQKNGLFIESTMVGIGFDGQRIFYIQYIGDRRDPKTGLTPEEFAMFGPYPFNVQNARTLITFIRLLVRRPLTPDGLAEVFGPKGTIAPKVVSAMINALKNWDWEKRGELFYQEWLRLFGIVYGEQFEKTIAKPSSILADWYKITGDVEFPKLLFAVHTYFALLMKLIAAELLTVTEASYRSSLSNDIALSGRDEFYVRMKEIEDGGIYSKRGINNFLEGDFFRWYIEFESDQVREAVQEMAQAFAGFEPATPIIYPEPARDLLKRVYQFLVPAEVRHSLGEYYTPDWLAELMLDEIGYNGNTLERVLDPSCGSGTFLVFAIQRARKYALEHNENHVETAKRIVNHIWGFDLNPLAVIASRTNYLFALGDLVDELKTFEIPVYLADSVLWPERKAQRDIDFSGKLSIPVKTSLEKPFNVPTLWLKDHGLLMKTAASIIENDIKKGFSWETAEYHLKNAGVLYSPHEEVVKRFYMELDELHDRHKDGIWARFLKNIFAPVTVEPFDFVVGNPPWIRWGYLAESYRAATLSMWKEYGLFSLKGHESRLGGGEKDFSMLFTYAAADFYLKNGGKLGFLITQEVFKAKGAGQGFRRFQLGEKEYLQVLAAHDLVTVQPFEGAVNKSAAIILKKGRKTTYPVPYYVWTRKKGVGKIETRLKLHQVKPLLNRKKLMAKPIDDETGSWLTIDAKNISIQPLQGENFYKARLGARVEPYGVFWLEILENYGDGEILIRNMPQYGKKKDELKFRERIEAELVFPAVRGADIERWSATPGIHVLMVQDPKTRSPYKIPEMMKKWPLTYGYLTHFKERLLARGSNTIRALAERTAFYAMFGIADYTFANYKVVWKRMASKMVSAVISEYKTPFGLKIIIPTDTTSIFATQSKPEAHYLCAILNSESVGEFIKSYSSAGRGFGSPSIMEHIGIREYNSKNEIHLELSQISTLLHEIKERQSGDSLEEHEQQVNELVLRLFEQQVHST